MVVMFVDCCVGSYSTFRTIPTYKSYGAEFFDRARTLRAVNLLNGRRSMMVNTTTNQKLAAAMKGSMEGRCDEREVRGKRKSIVLGALDVK